MIELLNKTQLKISIRPLQSLARKLFSFYRVNPQDILEIVIVTDREMKSLNCQHRGLDQNTDVLSFPIIPSRLSIPQPIGTIVLCPSVIKQQEGDYLFDPYLVHGWLHLMGNDHHTNGEQAGWDLELNKINKYIKNV